MSTVPLNLKHSSYFDARKRLRRCRRLVVVVVVVVAVDVVEPSTGNGMRSNNFTVSKIPLAVEGPTSEPWTTVLTN